MRIIKTNGITNLAKIPGSGGWYYGIDCIHGDLYEAEELFRARHEICSNRLILLHCPEGNVLEPIPTKEGQYFSNVVFHDGKICILLVDFPAGMIRIFCFDVITEELDLLTELPLSSVEDCYNLLLETKPLMLTRSSGDTFQIIWPERVDLRVGSRESFCFREDDRLYFSRWNEDADHDPEYWDEMVVRRYPTGEILEVFLGLDWELPDGQQWILQ